MTKSTFNLVEVGNILSKLSGNVPFFSRPSINRAIREGRFPKPISVSHSGTGVRKLFARDDIQGFIRKYVPKESLSEKELDLILS